MDSLTEPTSPPGRAQPVLGGWQRLVVAVLAGLAVTIVVVLVGTLVAVKLALSGVDPNALRSRLELGVPLPRAYLALNLAFSAAAAVAGGYVSGRIASGLGTKAVGVLAALLLLSGVLSVTGKDRDAPGQPAWYPYALLLLAPAGVLIGGSLVRHARLRERAAAGPTSGTT